MRAQGRFSAPCPSAWNFTADVIPKLLTHGHGHVGSRSAVVVYLPAGPRPPTLPAWSASQQGSDGGTLPWTHLGSVKNAIAHRAFGFATRSKSGGPAGNETLVVPCIGPPEMFPRQHPMPCVGRVLVSEVARQLAIGPSSYTTISAVPRHPTELMTGQSYHVHMQPFQIPSTSQIAWRGQAGVEPLVRDRNGGMGPQMADTNHGTGLTRRDTMQHHQ